MVATPVILSSTGPFCHGDPLLHFPGGSVVKNPPDNPVDVVSIPESGRSPGEGNGNVLQYSYWGNLMDSRVWWATDHGVTKS